MNRNVTLLTALGASLSLSPFALAQAAAAPAGTAPASAAAPAPQAVAAKIALINFEQVVLASNEGQTVTASTQKKFEPKKNEIDREAAEVDTLKKNLQAGSTLSDEEKATRLRDIDNKEKKLNRDAEDAQTQYNTEWQEGLGKVAAKLNTVMQTYVQQNGFTLLLDVSSQTSNVLWALQTTNVSQAVVDAYNKQSGVAAPPPPAPSAARSTPRPAARPAGK